VGSAPRKLTRWHGEKELTVKESGTGKKKANPKKNFGANSMTVGRTGFIQNERGNVKAFIMGWEGICETRALLTVRGNPRIGGLGRLRKVVPSRKRYEGRLLRRTMQHRGNL